MSVPVQGRSTDEGASPSLNIGDTLSEHMKNLLESGKYSDSKIRCSESVFEVHRAMHMSIQGSRCLVVQKLQGMTEI